MATQAKTYTRFERVMLGTFAVQCTSFALAVQLAYNVAHDKVSSFSAWNAVFPLIIFYGLYYFEGALLVIYGLSLIKRHAKPKRAILIGALVGVILLFVSPYIMVWLATSQL